LAAEVLVDALGVDLPPFQEARLDAGDMTALVPTEFRADAVVVLADGRRPVLAIVVEVQLARDQVKRWTWPVYLSTLRARLRCPAVLLVICVDVAIAAWCASPIPLGHPDWVLHPLVLGPRELPIVTDVQAAREAPAFAVLSALTHHSHPDRLKIFHALLRMLATIDQEQSTLYSDVMFAALPAALRQYLEDVMATSTYEYQSDFVRRFVFQGRAEGRVQGRAEGRAEAVIDFLDARGIEVPDGARQRIIGCTDPDQLHTWIRRAATVTKIDELFD
jgi:hypothetical protein